MPDTKGSYKKPGRPSKKRKEAAKAKHKGSSHKKRGKK